jgi:DNA-binding transcriptional LysR family regulator
VSQQLAALQREAGVPLLAHTGRSVRLTAAGTALVRHAETVFAALEAATADLAAARDSLSGTIRIGAFPTAVRTLLPPALVALAGDHPGLDLMVTELDPVAVPDALRDDTLDVGLLHDYDTVPVEPDPTLDSLPLLDETVFLAVPATTSIRTVADARDTGWIVGTPGTLCHSVAVLACRAAGFTPLTRHHADDFTAVLALVAAGQGVALVPRLGATAPPPGVRLMPAAVRRRTRVAHRRGAGTHPAVAACVAALRASVAGLRLPEVGGAVDVDDRAGRPGRVR